MHTSMHKEFAARPINFFFLLFEQYLLGANEAAFGGCTERQ